MQFVVNGPDIPDALLQAHEEGRVVFFCGAGISYPAGLPGFKGLVDKIYHHLGTTLFPLEKVAYELNQFDATLNLLEDRLPGQRQGLKMRKALAKALKPNLRLKGATDTHTALLQLAKCRKGELRLITTNFDRVFEKVARRNKQALGVYAAPMLPIPKSSRWNGLVYLHGALPDKDDDVALHRLVATSGDFGLAYLTERWAARFVGELFRNYVVCFVGYSINDPVMRYMMDALAADRMLGEAAPQAWAFGDCEPGEEGHKTIEWRAKGVTPILYEVLPGSHDHSALHKTLKVWGEIHRDGVLGKERIVVSHALARPSASTKQDDFVGRMLWALSDKSGLPAKRFADFNPVPSLDWLLDAFSKDRYAYSDLSRFDVPPRAEVDEKLRFSLIRRPAPYNRAPRMMLVSVGAVGVQWDDVMVHIARWLVRHLNDPALIIWIAERGWLLHDSFVLLIENELDRYARLTREGNTAELDNIRAQAPNAIPNSLMLTLWRLLLTGRVMGPSWNKPDIYRWAGRLKRDGLTNTLRLALRELLTPKIRLKKPIRLIAEDERTGEPERIKQLVDWELVLTADHVRTALHDLVDDHWTAALPDLLGDFQLLLLDATALQRELGEADDRNDRSHWDLPSISPHWQNRGFRDWVTLIELLRDAWLAVRRSDPERARRIAQAWFDVPSLTFKRLALFAASQDDVIHSDQWVEWLLSDDAWWLWSVGSMRETLRLLVLQGRHLTPSAKERLELAILAGPPRSMYRDDLEPGRWSELVARSIWLNLAKLNASGARLGASATSRWGDLSQAHPQWQLIANEREEFSHWMSGTGDPDFEASRHIDIAPRKRGDLVKWLNQPESERPLFYEDTWREVCRTRFFHSLYALCDLAQRRIWPASRWRVALQVWSEEGRTLRSWRYAAPLVKTMPDDVLREIVHGITWWLDSASKYIDRHESIFFGLCSRVLALPLEPNSGITRNGQPIDEPVTEAINHPIGHVAQALLNLWFKSEPNDNDRLPAEIKLFFTQLCDTQVARFHHGRVLLGWQLIALFRVDRPWTDQYLLPLFDWTVNLEEARAVWEGFLWSPRIYQPLMSTLKAQFLETARHYADFGEHRRQLSAFLTYAALESLDGYTANDFRLAVGSLPQEGLQEAAQALLQALEGAGDQREDYWRNRIQPFWRDVWPKSREFATGEISELLARLSIAAGSEFPAALTAVQDWLQAVEHPSFIVNRLYESGLCSQSPNDALRLLNAIIDDQLWAPLELGECLGAIAQSLPQLAQDPRHRRLVEYFRRKDIRSQR